MIVEVLVTANIQGDFAYMPRLFTAIRQLKQSLPHNALLIDTGRAWSPDDPISAVTGNRAPYVVLDAMGYHVAFVEQVEEIDRLQSQVQVRLIDAETEAIIMLGPYQLVTESDSQIHDPVIKAGRLRLPLPAPNTIQQLTVDVSHLRILHADVVTVPRNTLPDATIAGTVDFVVGEARYYQEKRGSAS